MKSFASFKILLCVGIIVMLFVISSVEAEQQSVVIVSDTQTQWASPNGWQPVVLCYVHPAWTTIPEASWIWPYQYVDSLDKFGPFQFRRSFTIPDDANTIVAHIQISGDDDYTSLAVNGNYLGEGHHWEDIQDYPVQLKPGENIITFHGSNDITDATTGEPLPVDPYQNPAGVHFRLDATYTTSEPPVANAGPDQTVPVGTLVTLDGTGSSDPDNNLPLTYAWIMSTPSGSTVTLSSTTAAKPTFTPDKPGDYVISLTVKDSLGLQSTVADSVTITVTNQLLVADFDATPTSGSTPLKVTFTDKSTGDVTSRVWQYKNSSESTWTTFTPDADSSFTFTDPGTYDVQLTVTGSGGSDTKTQINYIKIEPNCKVEVRAREVLFGQYHTRLIYTDENQKTWYFEGDNSHTRVGEDKYGCSLGIVKAYGPITDNGASNKDGFLDPYLVAEGNNVCGVDAKLKSAVNQINSIKTCYGYPGPNSNSVVYTLLKSVNLPTNVLLLDSLNQPLAIPGWGEIVPYITFSVKCPVGISIVDPLGHHIDKVSSDIPLALSWESDLDHDGDLDYIVSIPNPTSGDYRVIVTPKTNALPTDTFTLIVEVNGKSVVLAKDVMIKDIPSTPYVYNYQSENSYPTPEFPSTTLPVIIIIGFLGTVLLIQRTREY